MTATTQQLTFFLSTVATFVVLAVFMVAIDFVPEPRSTSQDDTPTVRVVETTRTEHPSDTDPAQETSGQTVDAGTEPDVRASAAPVATYSAERPVRIVINEIGIDTPVLTPASTDVAVLDRALLSGAVHYPDSPLAGEEGNMLIFGHSSYLPVVQNKAYQAFNELQKLTPGSMVSVYTDTMRYDYKVDRVRLARAEETVITFDADEPTLTLATCNTFGAKQERWVATATLATTAAL